MPKQHLNMGVEVFEHTTILIQNIFMTWSGKVTDFKDFLASGGNQLILYMYNGFVAILTFMISCWMGSVDSLVDNSPWLHP